jgi:branched-chain amino acid transport system substrate-binding protein
MKARVVIVTTVLGVLVLASCSAKGSGGTLAGGRDEKCAAQIGIEGPLTGQVAARGQEQLHFAELALAMDNKANKTRINLVKGDTELHRAQAMTVTQQLTLDPSIVAVVGPAGSGEVAAVGSLMARAGMPFVSGSATAVALTAGEYPTFFRVVATDSVQGSQDASYIVGHLHPKALMIVADAQEAGLVAAMLPVFAKAGIKVDQVPVPRKVTSFSALAAKVTRAMTVVVLPWQVASDAQRFGRDLAARHKKAVIFGTDGLFSPGKFTIAGSYVSWPGPDITRILADAMIAAKAKAKYGSFGTFGPPVFAATHVIDEAIASVCEAGHAPSRANVMTAIRKTNEPTSILGQPIRFDARGDLVNGRFFLFKVDSAGAYQLVPDSSP